MRATRLLPLLLLASCGACSNPLAPREEETALAAHRLARPDGPLLDAAEVFDDAEEAKLAEQLNQLERRTGHALFVVTAPSLGGEGIAVYTRELFERWGVGADGVVLLVAPEERKVRIATDKGTQKLLPDALCVRIVEQRMVPNFRKGAMVSGILAGVDAISAALAPTG